MEGLTKFRAKIKGDAGIYTVWGIDWLNNKALIERACGNELIPFKKIQALMQFTGLKDKNGKDRFEGDVIKWFYGDYEKPCITVVTLFDWPTNSEGEPIEVEIIGNRFENPELLKP